MTTLSEFRWLWIGLITAIALSTFGRYMDPTRILTDLVPLPWARIGTGILVFAAFAALHFRAHWVLCLNELGAERKRMHAAARLLEDIEMEASAGARIIRENLDLVTGGSQRPQEAELYLQGAQAHAAKIEQVFERLRGIRLRMDARSQD